MENFIKKGMLGRGRGFDNYSKRPRTGGRQGNTVRDSFEPTGADASSSFISIIAFGREVAGPTKDGVARSDSPPRAVPTKAIPEPIGCSSMGYQTLPRSKALPQRRPQFPLVSKTQSQKLEKNLKILFSRSF
jgi:hypothetical protein